MSGGVVIDASVGIKLVLVEEFSAQAQALVADTLSGGVPLYGPVTLPSEILSALYKRTRYSDPTKAISLPEAQQYLQDFLDLPITLATPADLYSQTLTFVHTHRLTRTYDPLYVVLAQLLEVELWTGDAATINRLGSVTPWVRWIGDYPLPDPGRETAPHEQ